jgi:hypothetical protein
MLGWCQRENRRHQSLSAARQSYYQQVMFGQMDDHLTNLSSFYKVALRVDAC